MLSQGAIVTDSDIDGNNRTCLMLYDRCNPYIQL
jgi:hypothetical protein